MIAVLCATRAEAAPLIERTGATEAQRSPFPIFNASIDRTPLLIAISGMGAEHAGQACRHLAADHGVKQIVNMGICGALQPDLHPGDIRTVSRVLDADSAGKGETVPVDTVTLSPWPGTACLTLGTASEPVFDADRRETLAKHCDAVDMEGWAIATACRELGIACYMLKGVSDRAGPGDRADLMRNLGPVAQRLADRFLHDRALIEEDDHGLLRRLWRFTRVEHTVFSLPLLFAGAWLGTGGHLTARLLGLIVVVGLGARTFGMAMNRILDRDIDARNPRTTSRELPTGRLSLANAYTVAAIGLAAYLLGCAGLGRLCLLLSPVPLIPLGTYALLKRFTPLCHFGIGICLATAPLGAFVAGSGTLPMQADILVLAAFTLLWIAGFDIIYALQDMASDREIGIRSIPAALGGRGAQVVAAVSHSTALVALAVLWRLTGMGIGGGMALLVAAGAFTAAYVPAVPLPVRFFPLSAIAGIAGACVVLLT